MDENNVEEMKGRLKEAAGVVTGDAEMKRDGKVDQFSAKAKAAIDSAAEKLKDAVDK
ncbi:MAG TPA: CsbD family protein [Coriobacteriia bacterium]|nr:CsbD family protein [Coriobacteriia bacterium]